MSASALSSVSSMIQDSATKRRMGWRTRYSAKQKITRKSKMIKLRKIRPDSPGFEGPCFMNWGPTLAGSPLLEQMIVPPVHQPYFVRHARRIRAQRIVFSLNVHDAFPLFLFLSDGIAENAALFIFKPFVRGAELVLDSPWHENGSRHLRMRMRPFFSR